MTWWLILIVGVSLGVECDSLGSGKKSQVIWGHIEPFISGGRKLYRYCSVLALWSTHKHAAPFISLVRPSAYIALLTCNLCNMLVDNVINDQDCNRMKQSAQGNIIRTTSFPFHDGIPQRFSAIRRPSKTSMLHFLSRIKCSHYRFSEIFPRLHLRLIRYRILLICVDLGISGNFFVGIVSIQACACLLLACTWVRFTIIHKPTPAFVRPYLVTFPILTPVWLFSVRLFIHSYLNEFSSLHRHPISRLLFFVNVCFVFIVLFCHLYLLVRGKLQSIQLRINW